MQDRLFRSHREIKRHSSEIYFPSQESSGAVHCGEGEMRFADAMCKGRQPLALRQARGKASPHILQKFCQDRRNSTTLMRTGSYDPRHASLQGPIGNGGVLRCSSGGRSRGGVFSPAVQRGTSAVYLKANLLLGGTRVMAAIGPCSFGGIPSLSRDGFPERH